MSVGIHVKRKVMSLLYPVINHTINTIKYYMILSKKKKKKEISVVMHSSVSPKDPTSHLILNCQTEAAEPEETERKSKMNIPPTRKATGEAHHIGRSYLQ